eukprot:gene9106-10079_t
MEDLNIIIERCENRASILGNKLLDVERSLQTVDEGCKNAKLFLDDQYKKIRDDFMRALDEHYSYLVTSIDKAKKKDVTQLEDLKSQLQSDLSKVNSLINKGKDEANELKARLDDEADCKPRTLELESELNKLNKSHSDILCSAMSISVICDDSKLESAIEEIKSCMNVNLTGGLHITECVEMPGGIIIKWDEPSVEIESVETDSSFVTQFTLQYSLVPLNQSNSEIHKDADLVFSTLYTGEEMEYFMTNVDINRNYYFRVCKSPIKEDCHDKVEAWSMMKRGWTTLYPHEWCKDDCLNEGSLVVYELGNDNKTATKVFPESCKVLRSNSASYHIGHVLNFNIDEAGERSSKDGIGLITKRFEKTSNELLIGSTDSIVVNSKGAIYVNGSVMTMRLPVFKRGTKLSFQTNQLLQDGKLRVTISNEDKEVTFDWITGDIDKEFSFAASFEHTGWQITVL